jgi:lipid II:glycine glycyltransferase (peptidoglycan interpeptide bridge formation enzyme)
MVEFSLVTDREVWNEKIIRNDNYNPYQLYEWGEYKKNMGWKIASIKANNGGKISYLQISYKIKLNIFVGWCIGSISGDIISFNKEELIEYIKSEYKIKYILIKSSFTNILNFDESLSLYSSGWSKVNNQMNSDYTIYVNLNQSIEDLLTNCSNNFRKNVKRGIKKNTNIRVKKLSQCNKDEISALFDRFRTIKDVPLPNKNELQYIKDNLSDNIIVATSTIDDQIVGLRAFLFIGTKALDFWATTDLIGRKNYTSFMLLFKLFEEAKNMGITEYDMSGIDTINNPTGFSFKNGLRASIAEKLGEWEISNSKMLSFLINRIYL